MEINPSEYQQWEPLCGSGSGTLSSAEQSFPLCKERLH